MRFIVEADSGHCIQGWITPDNPLAVSRVAVSVEGRRVAEVPATLTVEGLRLNGWHATGQCGFLIDDAVLPGLAGVARLELHDVDTNVLIHRRTPAEALRPDKIVLLNTSLHPETGLQALLYPFFRASYFGVDRFSEQIMASVLGVPEIPSLLVSGRIIYPRYEGIIDFCGAKSAILIQDPFVEMAARLIWLRERAPVADDPTQAWRLGDLAEAARFAKDYDYADVRHLKRFFRMLPEPAYHLLYNPTTRLLGTRVPEDRIYPAISVLAVESLARIAIVGHRDFFEAFAATLCDHLGIDALLPVPPPVPPERLELAARLRTLRAARDFLVYDTAIADGVRQSVARSWAE